MKLSERPLSKAKSGKTEQKSSGTTSNKPSTVRKLSRKDKDIPADRGGYEQPSESQGSE